jgi:NAD(P)H-dependent flavin oxidoreductase YrpB (nitropropane dioxygenase family)
MRRMVQTSTSAGQRSAASTAHPVLSTDFCRLVGVRYPIVQTGMGFVSDAGLTAATSEAGGLGIIAAAMMNLAELEAAIAEVKERTAKPFGVNLRSDAPDITERARVLIGAGVKVASFALAPSRELIEQLKEAGVVCVPSIGARRHAEKVAGWGVDAVIVQGGEGGGHTGQVATSVLLPEVVDATNLPVVAAGGFFDGRGLVAALAYGASGIAMGTRFLLTSDSPVPLEMKQEYLQRRSGETVVTSRVDGQPHRMLRSAMIDDLERSRRVKRLVLAARSVRSFKALSGRGWADIVRQGMALRREHGFGWPEVVMAANAPMLCRAAVVDGRTDIGIMSAGQVVGLIDDLPSCSELIERIVAEAAAVLGKLATG